MAKLLRGLPCCTQLRIGRLAAKSQSPYCCTLKSCGWPEQIICMCRNQDKSNNSEQMRRGQKQPRDRGFNPRDWEGSSSAAPAVSPRQQSQQQPGTKPGGPSSRPERTAARWLDDNKPNAAGVPGLNEDAGLDEWEPTGAGRKGWYNPQSSPSSAAASKEMRPVSDPMLNRGSGSGDRWRREETSSANSGELLNTACTVKLLQAVWWNSAQSCIMRGTCRCLHTRRS